MTHCAPVTNALKFLFRWLGQQSKRARWEDQRGGQVLKRERKIRRAVCSFTLIFFIALLDSQGKRGADDCVEGLGNVEMSRNKAAAGLPASSLCGVQGQVGWVSEAWHKVCKWFSLWTMHLAPNVLSRAFVGQGLICVGVFFSRVVLLQEWSVKERSSIGLVSALCYGCFTPDLIKTLSLIRLCLGQTSLCVFYSGSSLLRWPWTMSGETVGFFSSLWQQWRVAGIPREPWM